MTGFESDTQREGFNNAVGVVRLLAYPGSLYEGDNGPVQVFQAAPMQTPAEANLGIEPPAVGFEMDFTLDQLRTLQRLDQSGHSGIGTEALGDNMQVLRNDESGLTLSTLHRMPAGSLVAVEITFLSEDIDERLAYMDALRNPPPVMDREPYVEEPKAHPAPLNIAYR